MATYVGLPQVTLTAAADTTGRNTGNYTTSFTPANLPRVSQMEIYHMTVSGALVLASAQILIRNSLFSTVTVGLSGNNEWDPSEPAIINYGDQVDFLWNTPVSGNTAPSATLWLRYDTTLTRNSQPVTG
jgi:hypothetical protein